MIHPNLQKRHLKIAAKWHQIFNAVHQMFTILQWLAGTPDLDPPSCKVKIPRRNTQRPCKHIGNTSPLPKQCRHPFEAPLLETTLFLALGSYLIPTNVCCFRISLLDHLGPATHVVLSVIHPSFSTKTMGSARVQT